MKKWTATQWVPTTKWNSENEIRSAALRNHLMAHSAVCLKCSNWVLLFNSFVWYLNSFPHDMAMWVFIIVYAAAISVGFFVRFLWLPSCSSVSVYFTFQFIRLEDCLCYVYCAAFFFLSGVLLNLFWFSCDLHKTFVSSLLTLVVSKAFSSSFIIIDLALLPISYLWNMVHRINFILFIPLVRLQTHQQNLMNERI